MQTLGWKHEYATRVVDIDEQHRRIIEMVRGLGLSLDSGTDYAVIGQLLRGMNAYIADHFDCEERLLANTRYPELGAHRALHAEFLRRSLALQRQLHQLRLGEATGLLQETLAFLRDWLIDHIARADIAYVPHLVQVGIVSEYARAGCG